MASVLTFWRLPEEEAKFLDYLDKTGEIVACIYKRFSDPEQVEVSPIREAITDYESEDLLIAPRRFMNMTPITSVEIEGVTRYGRYYGDGPVICYTPPIWRAPGQLAQSNLCFDTNRGIRDDTSLHGYTFEPQLPEFMSWARRVMAWTRRHTTPCGYYRISPGAAAAVAAGDIELVT